MWLTLMVLFAALTPGVLFTIPSLGKKMGGKVAIAAMHAVLFVIVVNLLNVVQEGFQANSTTVDSLNKSLADAKTAMSAASDSLAEMSKQIDADNIKIKADNSAVAKDTATLNYDNSILQKHTDVYATIKQTIATIQNKMNDIQQQITAAQKAVVATQATPTASAQNAVASTQAFPTISQAFPTIWGRPLPGRASAPLQIMGAPQQATAVAKPSIATLASAVGISGP